MSFEPKEDQSIRLLIIISACAICTFAHARAYGIRACALASKPGLLPQFRTQLRAPTIIKRVGGKTEGEGARPGRFSHVMRALDLRFLTSPYFA